MVIHIKNISLNKKTINYVKEKYPELQIKDVLVKYEFKEMYYYSVVETKSGIFFEVKIKDGQMKDDYYVSIWKSKVSREVEAFIQKEFSSNVDVDFIINVNEEIMKKYENYKEYSDFGFEIEGMTKMYITIRQNFQGDESYRKCFSVIEWIIRNQKIKSDIIFGFKDKYFLFIDTSSLEKIKKWDDLKQYLRRTIV